jgi:glycerophosphoryl diester phosphodiesterase
VRGGNIPLFAYTVNLAKRASELLSWGVNAVFSDCPERVSEGLGNGAI